MGRASFLETIDVHTAIYRFLSQIQESIFACCIILFRPLNTSVLRILSAADICCRSSASVTVYKSLRGHKAELICNTRKMEIRWYLSFDRVQPLMLSYSRHVIRRDRKSVV